MNKKDILKLLLLIFLLGVALMVIRGEEDTWICVDGEWVKHGVPSAPKPTTGCGEEKINSFLEKTDLIRLDSPQPNQFISSPLALEGEARGYWFFEADFPVRLLDGEGHLIATGIAQAQGEWMTEDFVPFKAVLEFSPPVTNGGTLVLEKDNPSGLPENADELRIPIRFSSIED